MTFPNYHKWIEALVSRDVGTEGVILAALTIIVLLGVARFAFPKRLPLVRKFAIALFYATLPIFIAMSIK